MDKESKTIIWHDNYAVAKDFYDRNGHFPTHKENRRIRQWANVWYHKYAENNPDFLQSLLDIGYRIPDRWRLWDSNYRTARDFYITYGRALRPSDNQKVYRYFRVWAGNSGKDYPDRIRLLQEIGLDYKVKDSAWERNFNRAKNFYDKNGRFPTHTDDIVLAEWARRWAGIKGKEHPEMLGRLASIGYRT